MYKKLLLFLLACGAECTSWKDFARTVNPNNVRVINANEFARNRVDALFHHVREQLESLSLDNLLKVYSMSADILGCIFPAYLHRRYGFNVPDQSCDKKVNVSNFELWAIYKDQNEIEDMLWTGFDNFGNFVEADDVARFVYCFAEEKLLKDYFHVDCKIVGMRGRWKGALG